MDALWVEFSGDRLMGGGQDIVGVFTLLGTMQSNGSVRIVKRYHGKHEVVYFGQYDGEGLFYGSWTINMLTGNWSIKLLSGNSDQMETFEEFEEITG
jgi:hypothetical protein